MFFIVFANFSRARGSDTSDSSSTHNITMQDEKPKHYFKFYIIPKQFTKIRFDRLALLALLDR